MNAQSLTELADRLVDDLTGTAPAAPGGGPGEAGPPGDSGSLAGFFAGARPVDDDRELLAVTAALLRLRTIADHALARAADTIDRVGLPGRKHLRSAAAILTGLGAAPAVAQRAARLGAAVSDPVAGPVTRGMRDGAVSAELGDAVVRGLTHIADRTTVDADDQARIVASLLVQTSPARVREKARSLAIALTPEPCATDPDAMPVAERDDLNNIDLVRSDDGRVQVTMDLDVVAGEELHAALDPLTRPTPEPDGAADSRSAGRRRADGFIHLVRTYLSHSQRPESGGVLPHVTLLVPAGVTIDGQLIDGRHPDAAERLVHPAPAGPIPAAAGAVLDEAVEVVPTLGFTGPISARTAELVMCDAAVALALLDEHRMPLDVHDERRLFPPGLRKALAIRDGGCAFPGCGLPPSWCDAHHVKHWRHGGPTCLDNGVLLCRRHHTLIHHGGWEVFIGHDRHPWFRPPIDPDHPDRHREPLRADNRRTLTLAPTAAA